MRQIPSLVIGILFVSSLAYAQETVTPRGIRAWNPAGSELFLAQAPATVPDGVRIGFINFQVIAQESAIGKAATVQLKAFQNLKVTELDSKAKALVALQTQQATAGAQATPTEAAKIQRDIDRTKLEIQYAQEQAQQDIDELRDRLMNDLTGRVKPIVEEIRSEKGLWAVFVANDNLLLATPGIDLSMEVVKRLDAKKT